MGANRDSVYEMVQNMTKHMSLLMMMMMLGRWDTTGGLFCLNKKKRNKMNGKYTYNNIEKHGCLRIDVLCEYLSNYTTNATTRHENSVWPMLFFR